LTLTELFVLILATWRLTNLISDEDGPGDVLEWMRYKVGVRRNEHNQRYGRNGLAQGILCPWCLSVWVGMFWATLFFVWRDGAFWMALPFALSGGAILLKGRE
jgi:hypothetical protein